MSSFKTPSIFKHESESKLGRTQQSGRENTLHNFKITKDQETHSEMQSDEMVPGSSLPDVAWVDKVSTSLSNYVGIDNKVLDKSERFSIKNKLLDIDASLDTFLNNGAATKEQLDQKDSNTSQNRYTDAYKSVAGIESEVSRSVTNSSNLEQRHKEDENISTADQKPEYVNHGFNEEDIQNTTIDDMKGRKLTTIMVAEPPVTTCEIDDAIEDNQGLSVNAETACRGSEDKVRRLTGTEPIEPILNDRLEKKKKFLRACTTVAAFMTAYLGCCLPYYILSVIELSQGTDTEDSAKRRTVRMICALFLYLLPIIDPILYTLRFVIVRQTLGRVVPMRCRCREHNDE